MPRSSHIKTLSALLSATFFASLLIPSMATATLLTGGKAAPNLPPNEVHFLHASTLETDVYVIPHWVDYDEEADIVTGDENWDIQEIIDQAELVDADTIEVGDAMLSRLGESDVWHVEGWVCTVDYDVVSCSWETLGLLSTVGFDLGSALVDTQLSLDPMAMTMRRDARIYAVCAAISLVAVSAATMCVQGEVELNFDVLGYTAHLSC